jgi:hypothetical protein
MKLTQQQLEAHLWGTANTLRDKTAVQDYTGGTTLLCAASGLLEAVEHSDDCASRLSGRSARARSSTSGVRARYGLSARRAGERSASVANRGVPAARRLGSNDPHPQAEQPALLLMAALVP